MGVPKPYNDTKSYLCFSLDLIQTQKKERDLALLKTYGVTNYDLSTMQTEGSTIRDEYFYETGQSVTRMMAVSGLIRPTEGYVDINGKILGKDIFYPNRLGLLLENPAFLAGETGFSNLKILAKLNNLINEEQIRQTLVDVGLDPDDKRKYYKYSLGMKQKLGIALAIMEQPDILILDEPINALDAETAEKIKHIILREKERGAVVILACHDTEELMYLSDTIIEISEGRIINQKA